MSTIAELLQAGQPDLELAACTPRVLLAPYYGTQPLLSIEDLVNGGIDAALVGSGSAFRTVGNYEKKAGAKLSNKPTVNKIMSAGYGSPTRNLFSESGKSITYTPQEVNLLNLQNAWGFTPDAVSEPSIKGGITIGIPSLPARMLWRCVLIAGDVAPSGKPIYLYWIANRAEAGDRQDINATDSNVYEHGVTLDFQDDPAVADQVIFGICGDGWVDLNSNNDTGLYPAIDGITVTPSTASLTVAGGASHTKQLTVKDSNNEDVTSQATYVSADPTKATVSTSGLITAVAAGGPVSVTATYKGFSASCAVTVS